MSDERWAQRTSGVVVFVEVDMAKSRPDESLNWKDMVYEMRYSEGFSQINGEV